MTRPSWTSACPQTTWCVETVRSSTMDTLSASYSSPSQVSPGRHDNMSVLDTDWLKKWWWERRKLSITMVYWNVSYGKLTPFLTFTLTLTTLICLLLPVRTCPQCPGFPVLLPVVTGGPLPSDHEYELHEVRFHWGKENQRGSEHTVNGFRPDIEFHFVPFSIHEVFLLNSRHFKFQIS